MAGRARTDAPSAFVHSTRPSVPRSVNTSPPVAAAMTQPLSASGGAENPPVTGTLQRAAPVLASRPVSSSSPATTTSPSLDGGRLRRHEIDRPANRAAVEIDGHEAAALERHVGGALVDGGGRGGRGVEVDLQHRLQHEILVGASALHRRSRSATSSLATVLRAASAQRATSAPRRARSAPAGALRRGRLCRSSRRWAPDRRPG